VYKIDVDDRIYKTGNIPDPATGGQVAFFTNVLDVEHTGLDVVFTADSNWSSSTSTAWSAALTYQEVDVVGQTPVQSPAGPVLTVNDQQIVNIENNYPNERVVFSANTFIGENFNVMVRLNYFGEHLDENGVIGINKTKIDAVTFVDLDVGYQLNDNWRFNLGAINIFDEFVNLAVPPNANNLASGLQYPRRAAPSYEGGQWYMRGTYSF
jgi:iron complex outermembrane receptor protein